MFHYYTIDMLTFLFLDDRFMAIGITGVERQGVKSVLYVTRTCLKENELPARLCRLTDTEGK